MSHYITVCYNSKPKASKVLALTRTPTVQVINEMTDGGADYCFECVGMNTLVEEAFACCRKVYLSIQSKSLIKYYLFYLKYFPLGKNTHKHSNNNRV